METKQKKKVSDIMLAIACTMITLYAIASFLLQFFTGVEISPTLTTAWHAFWGCELLNITLIKTSKVKYGQDGTDTKQKKTKTKTSKTKA